jgi:hypothetical protein
VETEAPRERSSADTSVPLSTCVCRQAWEEQGPDGQGKGKQPGGASRAPREISGIPAWEA